MERKSAEVEPVLFALRGWVVSVMSLPGLRAQGGMRLSKKDKRQRPRDKGQKGYGETKTLATTCCAPVCADARRRLSLLRLGVAFEGRRIYCVINRIPFDSRMRETKVNHTALLTPFFRSGLGKRQMRLKTARRHRTTHDPVSYSKTVGTVSFTMRLKICPDHERQRVSELVDAFYSSMDPFPQAPPPPPPNFMYPAPHSQFVERDSAPNSPTVHG